MTSNQTSESNGTHLTPPKRPCASCMMLTVVLISGLIAGLGLTIIFDLDDIVSDTLNLPKKPRKTKSIGELRDRITDRYAEELDLSDAQKAQIHEVLTEYFSNSLQRRIHLLNDMTDVLSPVLDDVKKAQWEQMKADRIKKWSEGLPATQPAK